MALDAEALFENMLSSAVGAFGNSWKDVKAFVPTELRKLALQIADIAENVARFKANPAEGYPPITGKVLLRMQRRSLEDTLTAVTALTLLAVQEAINGILATLKATFGSVLDFVI